MKKVEIIIKLCVNDACIGIQFRDTYYIGMTGSGEAMGCLLKEAVDPNAARDLVCKLLYKEKEFSGIKIEYNYRECKYYEIKERGNDDNGAFVEYILKGIGITQESEGEEGFPTIEEIRKNLTELHIVEKSEI